MTMSPTQQPSPVPPPERPAGISFVVTVYNKRPFLPQMVAGLAAQQGDFAREYIFVDDGSTDGSADEVQRLTTDWTNVRIVQQENCGPSIATNRGIEAARHPFIKLVDADDVLLPWASAHLLRALRDNPGAVLARGETEPYRTPEIAFERLGQSIEPSSPPPTVDCDPVRTTLLQHFGLGPTNTLIATEAARRVGACDPRVFVQDYSLVLRLATAGPFVVLDETVALCAAEAEGRVNDDGPQVLHDVNLVIAHFLAEHSLPPALAARAVRRATGRAWRWARRREGASPLSRWSMLRLRALLPCPPYTLVQESCGAFTQSCVVRQPNGG